MLSVEEPASAPIGLTMGDPAGIGPEIVLRCHLVDELVRKGLLVVGSAGVLRRVATALGLAVDVHVVEVPDEVTARLGVVHVVETGNLDPAAVPPGQVNAECGQAVYDAIAVATRFASDGALRAVVSAPANKEAFNLAGHAYSGQTEIFAALTGTTEFHTLLLGGPLRVSLVSSHCSLSEAIERCTSERVEKVVRQLATALREVFAIPAPRIGVAGLNPHAGENGLLGTEEQRHIAPSVRRCREDGLDVAGPFAADSLFRAGETGGYDGLVGMYHDQGAIPLKRYGYVTYAVGLPIIRTTCGHGTAYDIAWQGRADPGLLGRAIDVAADLADRARA